MPCMPLPKAVFLLFQPYTRIPLSFLPPPRPLLSLSQSHKMPINSNSSTFRVLHTEIDRNYSTKTMFTSGSRIWSRGGAENCGGNFANVAERIRASAASPNWPGSRALRRALEALAFLFFKYAFSWFSGHLLLKFKRLMSPPMKDTFPFINTNRYKN